MRKYYLILTILGLFVTCNNIAHAATPCDKYFCVSTPIIQNMVAGSSQDVNLVLTSVLPQDRPAIAHCEFATSDNLSASFNNNGCTNPNGAGIYAGPNGDLNVKVTLKAGAEASGTLHGTLIFTQPNGRQFTVKIPVTINVATSAERTVTFKNYCPFNVYLGISSSAVPAKNRPTIPCTTNSDCSKYNSFSMCTNGYCGGGACQANADCLAQNPDHTKSTCIKPQGSNFASCTYCSKDDDCIDGAACDTANHQCFWKIPTPKDASTNNYQLTAYKGSGEPNSDSVTIPDYSESNGFALQWGGGFAGRTNCTPIKNIKDGNIRYSCKTANCNKNGIGDGNGGCNLGEGFDAPSTSAEVTFVSKTPDTYDVTIINGSNIPVSMHPTAKSALSPTQYNNPYICSAPGSATPITTPAGTIGGCDWNFDPQTTGARWVDDDNATQCQKDATCTSINPKLHCGLTKDAIKNNSAQKTCGTPLGYWNQNEICATNSKYATSIVDCSKTNIGGTGNSMINLLACTGNAGTSCFNESAPNITCCGCTNWQDQGIDVPTDANIVQQCKYNNIYWGEGAAPFPANTSYVLPGLVWMKKACPSAYVYPFDDKTSTFTCPSNNGQSAVNYTVDFCPGMAK